MMKIYKKILFLICLILSCSFVSLAAQEQRFSINVRDIDLEEFFSTLEKQTPYKFSYRNIILNKNKDITLKMENASIKEILNRVLPSKGLNFNFVSENSIAIIPLSSKSEPIKKNEVKKKITGVVVDEKGEPIIGANIVEKNVPSNGTITDSNGNFSLHVSPNGSICVSYIGYIDQEIKVKDKSTINVILQEDTKMLDEIVVVGYGTQKKINLTGSVAMVQGDVLENRPIINVGSGLQGLLPGVVISRSSGQPGQNAMSITVRGISTINSSTSPLILIDGIAGGDMNLLNPDDIESVSVLKDAASSAIYGARAANGVILITTKKGKSKDKTTISYSGYTGFQQPTALPELVNGRQYMELENEARLAAGFGRVYLDGDFEAYDSGSNPNDFSNTDWIDAIYKRMAFQSGHNISIRGGTTQTGYFISYGYLDQDGLVVGDPYSSKRHNLRMNLETELLKRLKINGNMSFVDYYRKDLGVGGTAGVFRLSQRISPLVPIYWKKQDENGNWIDTDVYSCASVLNPVYVAHESGYQKRNSRSLNTIINGSLKITERFVMDGQYAANYYNRIIDIWQPNMYRYYADGTEHPGNKGMKNTVSKSNLNTLTQTINLNLNYQKNFDQHHLKTLLGYSQEWEYTNSLGASRRNVLLDGVEVIDGGTEDIQNEGTASDWALRSYFGRVNYDFAEKYLFEANVRYDGTSRFSKNNRWGFFPSFSTGWRFTEESFMKFSRSLLDLGKLRLSWGELGNQDVGSDYYPYLTGIERVTKAYPIGNKENVGYVQTYFGNDNIRWETIRMFNVGLDFILLRNRLSTSFDWYKKRNIDALVRPIYPSMIGIARVSRLPLENIGEIQNKGWELALSWRDKIGDFSYSVKFNLADSNNKIVDLGSCEPILGDNLRRVGSPVDAYYGYLTDGLVQISDFEGQDEYGKYINPTTPLMSAYVDVVQPGDIKYRDISGKEGKPDGIIDEYDKVEFGNPYPRYSYSFKGEMGWKGIDFSFFLQGVGKVDGYLTEEARHCFINDYSVPKTVHLDRWTPNNPNASYPRLYYAQQHNRVFSDYWKEDASYLRLKNIQLGYSFPKKLLEKVNVNKLRIYISADNLLTFTNYFKSFDPEVRETSGDVYPQVKTFIFGLNFIL